MTTIGDITSRLRNVVKGVKQDAFLTDRLLYSLAMKYAKALIKREDNRNRIMKYRSLFQVLPCVELIDVDAIEACCSDVQTGCIFKRTKDQLPDVMDGSYGPILGTVSSIDGSVDVVETWPAIYQAMTRTTTFKYNKTKYYWYLNGYLYLPNVEWEAVKIEGIFEASISNEVCEDTRCKPRQEDNFPIPEYLFAEMEQMVLKDLGFQQSLPPDASTDKQNVLRS